MFKKLKRLFISEVAIDSWNLDVATAAFLAPRLKYLAENSHGHPLGLTEKEWYDILIRMADFFSQYEDEAFNTFSESFLQEKEEVLSLFTKHYTNLWD